MAPSSRGQIKGKPPRQAVTPTTGATPLPFQARKSIPRASIPLATPPSRPRLGYRAIPLVGMGVLTAGIPLYCYWAYRGYVADANAALARNIPLDVSDRFNHTAETYDADIGRMEWITGLTKLRKELASKAKGNVLEVSVGTGRNAKFYPLVGGNVKSVTMVDQSQEMLRQARLNWPKTNAYFINASFRLQSAADPIPSPDPEGFDTIVQTMGVCSTPDPVGVLKNLGALTKQDTGRILLLEHGQSKYQWLNNLLDAAAPAHADRHGCWWNKDVGKIVEESGLEVVEAKRYHFGTTWWFELKPPKGARAALISSMAEVSTKKVETITDRRPWWAKLWK